MALEVIILAAGMGKRMNSQLPKVLHPVACVPMLFHVIKTANELNPAKIHLVLGHQATKVQEALTKLDSPLQEKITISIQEQQLGTAHAVAQALPKLGADSQVITLYGDTPLTPKVELEKLLTALENCELSLLTSEPKNPFGYGRIIKDEQGNFVGIVEEKDASAEQKAIREINTGMIACRSSTLSSYLSKIGNDNAQGEYYLTDLSSLLVKDGKRVCPIKADPNNVDMLEGINNKVQLAFIERIYQQNLAKQYMMQGLTLADPSRFDVRGELEFGQDCFIDTNVIIEGKVSLGNNVVIGTGCVLNNVTIGDGSIISPYTIMEKSQLKERTTIGPFARLRPGNVLEDDVHVGNFVEVKNSNIGKGTKSGHLTYIGDSDIGAGTNIGAGTITCNYDGANKHRTTIGNDVFIGSDTQLVAPVTVEDGATVGAGTTVTKTVPANCLFITRAHAFTKANYKRPTKKPKK